MNKELKIAIAKNLLEDKTCGNCNQYFCHIKLGKEFGTCRKWKERKELDFSINSYLFKANPVKLNVSWTKQTETDLNDLNINLLDNNDHAVYKHLNEWKDGGALQILSEKSCTTCMKGDECRKSEMNDYGFCEEYEYFDGSAEACLLKEVANSMKKSIDEEVIKCL